MVKVLNKSLRKLEELQKREKRMHQKKSIKREQEIRDRTRKEVRRRAE